MVKKFNPKRKAANQGVSYVQKIVDEMDCVWRPVLHDIGGSPNKHQLLADTGITCGLHLDQTLARAAPLVNAIRNIQLVYSPISFILAWDIPTALDLILTV